MVMKFRSFLVLGVVGAVAVAFSTAVTANTGSQSFAAVSAGRLTELDIDMQAPGLLAHAGVSQSRAEQMAVAMGPPGRVIRESKLVRLVDRGDVPPIDRLCWAVSVSPHGAPHGPGGSKAEPFAFEIVFFDAQTGALVEGVRGN
jgi:hypothetical protein